MADQHSGRSTSLIIIFPLQLRFNQSKMQGLKKLKLSLIQLNVGFDKQKNIDRAIGEIKKAKQLGSKLVVLPVSIPVS
jgi:hypothetical protein